MRQSIGIYTSLKDRFSCGSAFPRCLLNYFWGYEATSGAQPRNQREPLPERQSLSAHRAADPPNKMCRYQGMQSPGREVCGNRVLKGRRARLLVRRSGRSANLTQPQCLRLHRRLISDAPAGAQKVSSHRFNWNDHCRVACTPPGRRLNCDDELQRSHQP